MGAPFDDNTNPVRTTYFKQISERPGNPADAAGHIPQLEDDGYFSKEWLRFARTYSLFQSLDGSATPVAVKAHTGDVILAAKADEPTRDSFIGFMKQDASSLSILPTYLNSAFEELDASNSPSFTADAGDDRVIVLTIHHNNSETMPTAVSWNGISFTKLDTVTWDGGAETAELWVAAIGSSGTNETSDITMTGGSTSVNFRRLVASVYANVDQTTPSAGVTKASTASEPLTINNATHDQGYGMFYGVMMGAGQRLSTTSGITVNVQGPGDPYYDVKAGNLNGLSSEVSMSVSATFGDLAGFMLALRSSLSPLEANVYYTDIVDGFSGLTPGATYYLSDTEGEISTTPGTTSVRIGKAISETEILITH